VFSEGEKLKLAFVCNACKKPIVAAGMCYTCGTGKKRTLEAVVINTGE